MIDLNVLISVLAIEACAILPLVLVFAIVGGSSSKEKELRAALAMAHSKIDELEKKLLEYEQLNRELQRKLKSLEQEYSKKLEDEVSKVREEYEKQLKEAQRISKVALTIVEALKANVLRLVDAKGMCKSIIVQPGQILCKVDDRTMKVLYPESRDVGEEIIVQDYEERPREARKAGKQDEE